jgi:hypothetical protein
MSPTWLRVPGLRDPRIPVALILATYVLLGMTVLGFNRSPLQVATTVAMAVGLDMLLHRLLRPGEPPLFPFSAFITGLGLSILVNYAHGPWLAAVPAFFAIASKYVVTWNGRHVYNPALFGVVASLLLADGMISDSPAYQWGGSYAIVAFITTLALFFVFRIQRVVLIVAFLLFYLIGLGVRAWLTRWHMPMETWILGTLTSPAFYLFTFFMVTDPQTSPGTTRGQILLAFGIALVDFALHLRETLSTLFYAAFLCATLRLAWTHGRALREGAAALKARLAFALPRWLVAGGMAAAAWTVAHGVHGAGEDAAPGFALAEVDAEQAGIRSRPSQVLREVDPRIAHVAKWVLSVGDAVAVADVDNDGLQDIFLSYPLKAPGDRAALYRNLGGLRFERVALPAIGARFDAPREHGLPAGAVFFDHDNDGDQDLLVLAGFGPSRLLRNRLAEDGKLAFEDITEAAGLGAHGVTVAANVADFDRDGRLDLVIGNAMSPLLRGYAQPVPFSAFRLPPAEHPGDRRMFDFMHRTWHDANNGGGMVLFHNRDGRFEAATQRWLGLEGEHRWTTAIGAADLDGDGWPDLYASNDFGPDQLLLNRAGGGFTPVRGRLAGAIGRDTYKGMNVSIADFDGSGRAGIYVSNVHEKLQAEGSLLWTWQGDAADPARWSDQAMRRNALNEKRFGWGAAAGDIDRDGRIDILQANGMVDNAYDGGEAAGCPDYWYWNDKIALTRPDVHGFADRWADLRGRCIFPHERNRIYLNRGRHFVDVAERAGWGKPGNSRGVALVDLDNDGALDVLVTHQFAPVSIFHNQPGAEVAARGWIGLALVGNGRSCNRDAIGTRVTVEVEGDAAGPRQWREVLGANGFSAQGDRRLVFGLPGDAAAVTARVHWCGSAQAEVYALTPRRYHRIEMGTSALNVVRR